MPDSISRTSSSTLSAAEAQPPAAKSLFQRDFVPKRSWVQRQIVLSAAVGDTMQRVANVSGVANRWNSSQQLESWHAAAQPGGRLKSSLQGALWARKAYSLVPGAAVDFLLGNGRTRRQVDGAPQDRDYFDAETRAMFANVLFAAPESGDRLRLADHDQRDLAFETLEMYVDATLTQARLHPCDVGVLGAVVGTVFAIKSLVVGAAGAVAGAAIGVVGAAVALVAPDSVGTALCGEKLGWVSQSQRIVEDGAHLGATLAVVYVGVAQMFGLWAITQAARLALQTAPKGVVTAVGMLAGFLYALGRDGARNWRAQAENSGETETTKLTDPEAAASEAAASETAASETGAVPEAVPMSETGAVPVAEIAAEENAGDPPSPKAAALAGPLEPERGAVELCE